MNIEDGRNKLKQNFGFDSFRDGQEAVISRILSGHSVAAIFPTGAGKSLCYQIPALLLPGITLVVSPLLSLMQDQLNFLKSKGVAAASLDSTLTREEYAAVLKSAVDSTLKILMVSVERFRNERFRTHLSRMNVSLLVVDEAHCISEWGHNFRPEYLKLASYREEFKIPQVLLLTATATETVASDMCSKLAITSDNLIRTGFYRKNLHIQVTPVAAKDKVKLLIQKIKSNAATPTIIYVTLQKTAEELSSELVAAGIESLAYHAGMESDLRKSVQNKFMSGEVNVITATIAFGMGIDKRDIRQVIHYDIPKSIEGYSQEIGRAGRDGKNSICELFACGDGVTVLENFVYGDTPRVESIKIVLKNIINAGPEWEVKLLTLVSESNIRELPLKTLLVYLEMQGIISPTHSYFSEYEFKPQMSFVEILEKFSGEPKEFLESLLGYAREKKTWTSIDIEKFVKDKKGERKRAVAALEYLETHNMIELSAKQAIDVYRVNKSDFDIDKVADWFADKFRSHEESEIRRINQIISFFEQEKCISRELARFFGEKLTSDCGHCSVCLKGPAKMVFAKERPTIPNTIPELSKQFRTAAGKNATPEQITRFLCGIQTPFASKIKARAMEGFGSLENYRYADILAQVKRQLFPN